MAKGKDSVGVDILHSVTMGQSGNMYKELRYNATDTYQIRVEMRGNSDGIVFEKGAVQYVDGTAKFEQDKKVLFDGGTEYIPESLRDYGKGTLVGSGTVFLNPSKHNFKVWEIKRNTGLIIERGYFLACDKKSGYGEGGFSVETTWNTDIRTDIDTMKDITTTIVKGKGVLVLDFGFDESKLTQITVDGRVRLNDNVAVMRTSGIKKEKLSDEENQLFSNYSGAVGRGFAYTGRGVIWVNSDLLNEDNKNRYDESIIGEFHKQYNKVNNVVEEDSQTKQRGAFGALAKLTDKRW